MGTILFVASNPSSAPPGGDYAARRREAPVLRVRDMAQVTTPLELAAELRDIRAELLRAGGHDLRLLSVEDATVVEVIHALAQVEAEVVHFSGHGTQSGLVFAGEDGSRLLNGEDFATLLCMQQRVRLVVLNACFSMSQADQLLQIADFVIATRFAIHDRRARDFSSTLYYSLATGRSLAQSFAVAQVAADGSGEPRLLPESRDASREFFSRRPATRDGLSLGRGEYEVCVLERAGAEEHGFHTIIARNLATDAATARRRLEAGTALLPGLSERAARERMAELRALKALVTCTERESGDGVALQRDRCGIWLGAVRLPGGKRCWLGVHPVTRDQYARVTGARRPFRERWLPQADVTWAQAQGYCELLNAQYPAATPYRLPTREEWLTAVEDQRRLVAADPEAARHLGCVRSDRVSPVGQYWPSARGFLDLVGNVAEWTSTEHGSNRVICGSSYASELADLQSDWTRSKAADCAETWLGLRIARDAEST